MIDISKKAAQAIYAYDGLPVTLEARHPRPVAADSREIVRAAREMGYAAAVEAETTRDGVMYTVKQRPLSTAEQEKEDLKAKGFPTYADYVRDRAEGKHVFTVSHMGATRRQAHARIRYALDCDVTLSKIAESTTRVTLCKA